MLAFRGVSLEGLEVAVIVVAFGAGDHAIGAAAIGAAGSVLLVGALGAASYRVVARIPRRALQLFVGALLTAFGTFWAAEGLGADWPGGDLALLWLVAVYVTAALALVRVVSSWRRGTLRRLRAQHPLTEGASDDALESDTQGRDVVGDHLRDRRRLDRGSRVRRRTHGYVGTRPV